MFGNNMGAPLFENFDGHEPTACITKDEETHCGVLESSKTTSVESNHCITQNGEAYCKKQDDEDCIDKLEITKDDVTTLYCKVLDDDVYDPSTISVDNDPATTSVGNSPFVGDGEVEEEEEDEVEDEVEDDEEDFVGNNVVEGFGGHSVVDKVNVNFILKCILFACLFYILAHDDSRNYIIKMVKTKKDNYIYLSSILFLVIYFILNLIL